MTHRAPQIAYVGFALPERELSHHPAASVAGNRYQVGLLTALGRRGKAIAMTTVAPNAMWRGSGRLWAPRRSIKLLGAGWIRTVPYINVLLLKQASIALGVLRELAGWARKSKENDPRIILVYNPISYVAGPAVLVSKVCNIPLVLLLADVPIVGEFHSGLYPALGRLEARTQLRLIRTADALIGLTEHAGVDLAATKPSIVIEGGFDGPRSVGPRIEVVHGRPQAGKKTPFKIVYAGALNSVSGIELAVSAVEAIDTAGVELHVYGSGSLSEWVAAKASEWPHGKLIFHGQVSHDEVQQAEADADLLICPRLPDGYVTRYTFPSKLIEYMAVGVPVMCNSLEGIPREYLTKVIVPANASRSAWTRCIADVMADPSGIHWERARVAAEFIRREKSWDAVTGKLINFLDRIG